MTTNLVNRMIERAKRTPYFHLYHADGSPYMHRYWLVPFPEKQGPDAAADGRRTLTWRDGLAWVIQRLGWAVRIHHIHTPDHDRHMHDHPWLFVSVVLRGFYVEATPLFEGGPVFNARGEERERIKVRRTFSFAWRDVWERHRIVQVSVGGVWTLFITGPKRQSWGFFTPMGWVPWEKYESVHNTAPIAEKAHAVRP